LNKIDRTKSVDRNKTIDSGGGGGLSIFYGYRNIANDVIYENRFYGVANNNPVNETNGFKLSSTNFNGAKGVVIPKTGRYEVSLTLFTTTNKYFMYLGVYRNGAYVTKDLLHSKNGAREANNLVVTNLLAGDIVLVKSASYRMRLDSRKGYSNFRIVKL